MNRRDFFKHAAIGAGSISAFELAALGISACKGPAKGTSATGESEGPGQMEIRTNPKNGDKISLLGFGCMRWPMYKGDDGKDHIDQNLVNEMVDYALEHGVNYFDSSPAYLQGQSEAAAGEALGRHPRNSYFIATKLSNFGDHSREGSLKMYYDSYKYFKTDYFDYYLIHSIGRGGIPEFNKRYVDNGMMDFLLKEREAGRIRNLGFSFHGQHDAFDSFMELHEKYRWDFVQIEMNYLDWRHAKEPRNTKAEYLYEALAKKNIPIVIMEPLLGGRLAKMADGVADKLLQRDPYHSVASWAFRFVGSYPGVLTALSGMVNMEVLEENVRTFSHFKPLTDEEKAFLMDIAQLLDSYPTVPCNDCKYCMPCPYGVDIPGVFTHYNAMVNSGSIATSAEQKDFQRLKRKYLVSYDRAIESLRQANHCIHCRQCVPHCPQSINIPSTLTRIDRYVEGLKKGKL